MKPLHLTASDIVKVEEILDAQDLEFAIAVIDQIVAQKVRPRGTRAAGKAGRRRTEDPAMSPIQAPSPNEEWFMRKFYELTPTNKQQILDEMAEKMKSVPESERETCGWYIEGIANEYGTEP